MLNEFFQKDCLKKNMFITFLNYQKQKVASIYQNKYPYFYQFHILLEKVTT